MSQKTPRAQYNKVFNLIFKSCCEYVSFIFSFYFQELLHMPYRVQHGLTSESVLVLDFRL